MKPDNRVAEKFEKRGWVLGKSRGADVCPSCASGDPEAKLADNQITNTQREVVLSPGQLAEQLFMPGNKRGDRNPVVVEQRGTRPMSRARQQAEVEASSIFAKPAERPLLGLGGSRASGSAAAPSNPAPPASQRSEGSEPGPQREAGFEDRVEAVLTKFANGMNNLTGTLSSLVEKMAKMEALQDSLINQTKDQSAEQQKLSRQNNEAIARLAPLVSNTTDVILGNVREAVSEIRQLTHSALPAPAEAASPAPSEQVVSTEARDADAGAVPAAISEDAAVPKRQRRRRAQAVEEQPGAVPEATAVVPTVETPTGEAVAAEATESHGGEAPKRRRTKEEIAAARELEERLAALGLKRGRGRPSKDALTDEEMAEVGASADPVATLAAIRERKAIAAAAAAAQPSPAAVASPAHEAEKPSRSRKPRAVAPTQTEVPEVVEAAEAVEAVAAEPKKATRKRRSASAEAAESAVAEKAPETAGVEEAPVQAEAVSETTPELNATEEPSASAKRGRRTKAEIEAAAELDKKLAKLGLKRGRGRPSKDALTADELAEIGASARPKATLKAILERRASAALSRPSSDESVSSDVTQPKVDEGDTKVARGRGKAKTTPENEPAVSAPLPDATGVKRAGRKAASTVSTVEATATEAASESIPAAEPDAPLKAKGRGKAAAAKAAPAAGKGKGKASQSAASATAPAQVAEGQPEKRPRGRPKSEKTLAREAEQAAKAQAAAKTSPKALSQVDWSKVPQSHDVMVLTMGGVTTFQIARSVWDEAGFGPDDKVKVETNGEEFRLSKSAKGTKPGTMASNVVMVSFPGLEVVSLWKIQHATENGTLLLRGEKAL